MNEVSEAEMLEAIKFAHEEIKKHCEVQLELQKETGKEEKRSYSHESNDDAFKAEIEKLAYDKVYKIAASGVSKHERHDKIAEVSEEIKAVVIPEDDEEAEAKGKMFGRYFHDVEKKALRDLILDKGQRVDGRKTDEIRDIWCEIDYLPAAHGSAIFTRGETQSLTTCDPWKQDGHEND